MNILSILLKTIMYIFGLFVIVGTLLAVFITPDETTVTKVEEVKEVKEAPEVDNHAVFIKHLKKYKFIEAAKFSTPNSLWVVITRDHRASESLYKQVIYNVCIEAKSYKLTKFSIHLFDARAMAAGELEDLTPTLFCK